MDTRSGKWSPKSGNRRFGGQMSSESDQKSRICSETAFIQIVGSILGPILESKIVSSEIWQKTLLQYRAHSLAEEERIPPFLCCCKSATVSQETLWFVCVTARRVRRQTGCRIILWTTSWCMFCIATDVLTRTQGVTDFL